MAHTTNNHGTDSPSHMIPIVWHRIHSAKRVTTILTYHAKMVISVSVPTGPSQYYAKRVISVSVLNGY